MPRGGVTAARVRCVVDNSVAVWRVMGCDQLRARVYGLYELDVVVLTMGVWSFGILLNMFNSLPRDGGSVIFAR